MKEKINFKEAMAVLSGLHLGGVDVEKATKKIEHALRNSSEYTYDERTSLKENIKYFYESRGLNDCNRIILNFKRSCSLNHNNDYYLNRLAQSLHIPMNIEISMLGNKKTVVEETAQPNYSPLPVVWKTNESGEEEAFCPKCGKKLHSWICTTDRKIRSYTPCSCK